MQEKAIENEHQEMMRLILHQNQIKAEVDKIDRENLNKVPVGLSKLSNVVNNKVIKKTVES